MWFTALCHLTAVLSENLVEAHYVDFWSVNHIDDNDVMMGNTNRQSGQVSYCAKS